MNRRQFLASTVSLFGAALSRHRSCVAVVTSESAGPASLPSRDSRSTEASAVFAYIRDNFGKKMMTAQHGGQRYVDQVIKTTGKAPAIWGIDLIFRRRDPATMQFVKDAWKAGAIPTIMWHWGAPTKGDGFEQSKSTIDINKCFQAGTPENDAMWLDLKHRADFLTQLRDANIPVLWRPLHECSGGWFWWDKGGPDLFIQLWRTMHDYFTKERGLDNLIWVLGMCGNPKPSYNPGPKYYDIIGGDRYGGQPPWPDLFSNITAIAPKGMPVTMHECDVPPDPKQALEQNAMWSWFMIWDSFLDKVDPAKLTATYHDDLSITLDKLPHWS